MPTYEYECQGEGHRFEAVQSFSDDPLTTCRECGGPVRKLYSAAGIIFKGSGYYVTDSRAKAGNGARSPKGDDAPAGKDGGGKGEGKASASESKSSESKSSAADGKSTSSKKPSTE